MSLHEALCRYAKKQKSGAVETNLRSPHALTLHRFFARPRPLPVDIIHDRRTPFSSKGASKSMQIIIQVLDPHTIPRSILGLFPLRTFYHTFINRCTPLLSSSPLHGDNEEGSRRRAAARFSSVKRGALDGERSRMIESGSVENDTKGLLMGLMRHHPASGRLSRPLEITGREKRRGGGRGGSWRHFHSPRRRSLGKIGSKRFAAVRLRSRVCRLDFWLIIDRCTVKEILVWLVFVWRM